jgi:hypothetical protein
MHQALPFFMKLFEGFNEAYGVYSLTGEKTPDGKLVGKALTIRKPVELALWDDHLCGRKGLGITPINRDSKARFGAIDVDDYSVDAINTVKRINEEKMPLIVIRSKSGGMHLYMFLTDFVDAEILRRKLRELAAVLGFGNCEIYPRQSKILVDRGDLGQWINMPYFNAVDTKRYAIGPNFKALSVDEFVRYVDEKILTPQQLEEFDVTKQDVLENGPPCLQILIKQGFPKGTRNNGLMNLGVYAKLKSPDEWEKLIEDFNNRYMDPPLPSTEVLGVMKSLRKKQYNYTCSSDPIHTFCNSALCRCRKYGIGGDNGMPVFGSLTKLNTSPPIWFIEIQGGGRMELTTDDLQQPTKFQKRCMDVLNIMPKCMKRNEWEETVQRLIAEVQVIDVPPDSSSEGQLLEHILAFCTSRLQGKMLDDLLLSRPVLHSGRIYFRMKDLMLYLDRKKVWEFKVNKVASILREHTGKHHFLNMRGQGVNCWSIAEPKIQDEKFEIPGEIKESF